LSNRQSTDRGGGNVVRLVLWRIGRWPCTGGTVGQDSRLVDAESAFSQALSTISFIPFLDGFHRAGLARADCTQKTPRNLCCSPRGNYAWAADFLVSLLVDRSSSMAGDSRLSLVSAATK